MIPLRLEIQNFLAYRAPSPLSFEGIHVGCLAGENGAGKSSLLDAMTWVLWGKARSNSADDLIHQGETEMRVCLEFALGPQRYQAIRQRKAGKTGQSLLELQVLDGGRWRGVSEHSVRATQEKLNALLRLDYDTFVNSAFILQGRADEFTTKTPAARKQVLANILGLSDWEAYEDKAKDEIRRLHDGIQRVEGQLQEIERELNCRAQYEVELAAAQDEALKMTERLTAAEKEWSDIERTRAELVTLQRQIDDLTGRVVQSVKDLKELDRELATLRLKADTTSIAAEIERAHALLDEIEAREAEYEALSRDRQAILEANAQLKGENDALGPQTEPLKRRVELLGEATEPACPTCGQPLTEDHRHRLIGELHAEVEARRGRYRQNQARMKELGERIATLDRSLAEVTARLRDRLPLQKKLSDLQAAHVSAEEARAQVEVLAERRRRWEANLESVQASRDSLEKEADLHEQRLIGASAKRDELDRLRYEKRLADERVGGARQTLAALASYEKQRKARLEERARLAEEKDLYEALREAFGKRGVPAMIIEAAVPEIEQAANELLNRMTAGRMNVRIETQREIKTGDLRESLDIFISDDLGTRSYEMYSGGEAFRVDFAIRIALSKLLARRAGAPLRTLFVDEGFGSQDAAGRERLVAAIHTIQDDFDLILVITHIEELKDVFPTRIDVIKTPNGSEIQVN